VGRAKETQFTVEQNKCGMINILKIRPFGAGVEKVAEIRALKEGFEVQSHDSPTLAEHGTLGILVLLILFITPLVLVWKTVLICLCCVLSLVFNDQPCGDANGGTCIVYLRSGAQKNAQDTADNFLATVAMNRLNT
jgi:hypothetical protein